MSILIRGMEMPKSCAECPVNMNICKRGYKYLLAHMELYDQRADDCPITTVPAHGRLIDADALRAEFQEPNKENGGWLNPNEALVHKTVVWAAIDAAPTIIPAEEGE